MPTTYRATLTNVGAALVADAIASGTMLTWAKMALGDGNGSAVIVDAGRTSLVNERYRAPLNDLGRDSANPNTIVGTLVVPPETGGWTIREFGIYDNASTPRLVAYGETPEIEKPASSAGTGINLRLRFKLVVSAEANITLSPDSNEAYATIEYVKDNAVKSLSVNGRTITYTMGDGDTHTIKTQDTTYDDATQSEHGLMSAEDKKKLDGITPSDYVQKSGDTLTGPLDFRNAQADYTGNPVDQIRGTMGGNDLWRIAAGASANDAGYLEIATADNGNEPVYVSQYTGSQDSFFGTLKRRATLLDASGNTDFPGNVSASSFIGALTGNVTGDVTGNVSGSAGWLKTTNINHKNIDTDYSNTYVIGLSDDNHGTRPNGSWTNLISIDSYHFQSQLAVTNIETGTHVPKFFVRSKYYTGPWSDWVHLADDTEATASAKGLMSAADKSKLDSIDSTYLPLSGGTLTGALVLGGSNVVIRQKNTTAESRLCGGTDLTDGAFFIAYGKDNGGGFRVRAFGNHDLVGSANGELTWKSLLLSPIKYASFTNDQAVIEYENKFQVVVSGGTAANEGTITFVKAFSKRPIVICQHPGTVLVHAQAHTVTTTGFTVAHSYSSAVAIRYIAIGEGV